MMFEDIYAVPDAYEVNVIRAKSNLPEWLWKGGYFVSIRGESDASRNWVANVSGLASVVYRKGEPGKDEGRLVVGSWIPSLFDAACRNIDDARVNANAENPGAKPIEKIVVTKEKRQVG